MAYLLGVDEGGLLLSRDPTATKLLLQVVIIIIFVSLAIRFSNMYMAIITSTSLWVIILLNINRLYSTIKKVLEAYNKLDVFNLSYYSLMTSLNVIIILIVLISILVIRQYLNGLNILIDPWIHLI